MAAREWRVRAEAVAAELIIRGVIITGATVDHNPLSVLGLIVRIETAWQKCVRSDKILVDWFFRCWKGAINALETRSNLLVELEVDPGGCALGSESGGRKL
jgi:hypothetical protein